jgi:hypothetical protein
MKTRHTEYVKHRCQKRELNSTGSIPSEVTGLFPIYVIFPAALRPGVYSASNRHEYQKCSWGKGQATRKSDNITAICEPTL